MWPEEEERNSESESDRCMCDPPSISSLPEASPPCEMEVEEVEALILFLVLVFVFLEGFPWSEGNVRTGELREEGEEPVTEAEAVAKTRSWSANLRSASPMSLREWK